MTDVKISPRVAQSTALSVINSHRSGQLNTRVLADPELPVEQAALPLPTPESDATEAGQTPATRTNCPSDEIQNRPPQYKQGLYFYVVFKLKVS